MYGINGGVFLYFIKKKDKNGLRGDPAYYLEKGLKKRWMGGLFTVSCLTLYSKYNYSCQSQFVNDTNCIKMAN